MGSTRLIILADLAFAIIPLSPSNKDRMTTIPALITIAPLKLTKISVTLLSSAEVLEETVNVCILLFSLFHNLLIILSAK